MTSDKTLTPHAIPEVSYTPFTYTPQINRTVNQFYDPQLTEQQVEPVAYKTFKDSTLTVPVEYVIKEKRARKATLIGFIIVLVLLTVGFSVVSLTANPNVFVLALIPLWIGIMATFWVGKWDPEPLPARIGVFLWGAAGAVGVALFLGTLWEKFLPSVFTMPFSMVAVQAPIVEEFAKSLIVLFFALKLRKFFTGPVDGIVYIMLTALGFAFTENILYFIQALNSGGNVGLSSTFVLRGLLSPFAHPLFSLPMGIMLGLAVERRFKTIHTVCFWFIGYLAAMVLHFVWNASSFWVTELETWVLFYGCVQIPLFIGAVVLISRYRKQEAFKTYRTLTWYGWYGWFTKPEIETLGTWEGRRYTKTWLKTQPVEATLLSKNLNRNAVKLSNLRPLIDQGKPYQEEETKILTQMWEDKTQMLKLS